MKKLVFSFLILFITCIGLYSQSPTLDCPVTTTDTIFVAPSCTSAYEFEITTNPAILPNGFSQTQTAGNLSGTPLVPGMYDYGFEIIDMNGAQVDFCTWSIVIAESATVGAEISCLPGPIVIDVSEAVAISADTSFTFDSQFFIDVIPCIDFSLLQINAIIPTGDTIVGPTVTFVSPHFDRNIPISVFDPNGINSCTVTLYLDSGRSIPTLSEWGVILLGLCLSIIGIVAYRKRIFIVKG